MHRLISFELGKIWRKRSFLLSVCAVVLVNLFFLWYFNLPGEQEAPLGAYRQLQKDISGMSEQEKLDYVSALQEEMEGITHVKDVLFMESISDASMAAAFADSERQQHPGMFEEYYPLYESGEYLHYTDSLEQERAFITEIYEELQQVSYYSDYLEEVQQTRSNLSGISIFATDTKDDFSSRNIEKSAEDYSNMKDVATSFYPSRGVVSVTDNQITDLLLILIVFLLVGGLIYEEKSKRLFFITRATGRGRGMSIGARLAALAMSVLALTVLLFGTNILYYGFTTGLGDLSRSIQSVAAYYTSCLHLSVLEYLLLTLATKAVVMFLLGTLLTFLFLSSRQAFTPYLMGAGLIGVSFLCYQQIPAVSQWNWLKYLNVIGLLKTEHLYGSYLNFNCFGYPVSRVGISWGVLAVCIMVCMLLSVVTFLRGKRLSVTGRIRRLTLPFRPHIGLFRHETYKLLIMNRALPVLILFVLLMGNQNLTAKYSVTPYEKYYQSMLLQLEGEMSIGKRGLIHAEWERYNAAFQAIARIDGLVASGELSEREGDNRKLPYYNEVVYYNAFQRVVKQYEHVRDTGGKFVYDTGYSYLLGIQGNSFLTRMLLMVIGLVFAWSNACSMEAQRKSWGLLSATAAGRKKIISCKLRAALLWTGILYLVEQVTFLIPILRTFPLHMLTASTADLPAYYGTGIHMPIIFWLLLTTFLQLLALEALTLVILAVSRALGAHIQTLFTCVCMLGVPLFLGVLGIQTAEYVTFFPLFDLGNVVQQAHGGAVGFGYLGLAVFLGALSYLSLYDLLPKVNPVLRHHSQT